MPSALLILLLPVDRGFQKAPELLDNRLHFRPLHIGFGGLEVPESHKSVGSRVGGVGPRSVGSDPTFPHLFLSEGLGVIGGLARLAA
jgi:hypothetical protein